MTTEIRTIEEQARVVERLRREAAEDDAEWAALQAAFREENEAFLLERTATHSLLAGAEETLREMALAEYNRSLDKAPGPGIVIRIHKVISYDANKALAWAIDHRLALALDKARFEELANISVGLDFVTRTEEPRVTIATDLAKALGLDE